MSHPKFPSQPRVRGNRRATGRSPQALRQGLRMARRRRQPRRCRIAAPRGGWVCSGNHAVSSTQFSHNAARRAGRAGRQNRLCHVTSATWRRARQGLSAPARPLEPSRLRSTRRGNHGSRAFRRCCHLAERSRFGRVGHLLFKEGGQWLALGLQFVHAGIWRGGEPANPDARPNENFAETFHLSRPPDPSFARRQCLNTATAS